MALQHEVWSVPPGKERQRFQASYEQSKWQWAMKLAAMLEDSGHSDVEIRDEEVEDEEEEEEIDEETEIDE